MLAHHRGSIREFARVFVSILLVSLLSPGPDWRPQPKAGPVSRPPVHAALAGAFPAVSIPIQLTASTVPSQGEAGVNLVYVTSSGFPSGTIPPINVTVSFAATCGGAPLANATATGVQTLLGTTRRVQVQIPSGLTPNTYAVSLNGTTSTGTSFSSVNCSSVQVIPLATLTLTPNSGNPGSTVAVTISRSNPGFVQGSTVASFGAGTSVGGAADGALGPVTVVSPTSATAQVTINGNAAGGVRTTLVATGSEQLLSSFTITSTANPPVLQTVNPNTGQQGQTNESVNLTGQFTHWVQGTSTASFGAGITVASLTVNTATTATAVVNIDATAAAGARNVSVTTGAEVVTLTNGFTVTNGTAVLTTVNPNTGQQGQTNESVNLTGQFTHWVQGTSTASFGAGITVASLTVNTATTATAVVNIDAAAAAGARNVSVTTGAEVVTLTNGFTVTNGTAVLTTVNPNTGQQGQTNESVNLTGQFTHWVQGTSTASFGAGITVASLTVNTATTATAVVNIDAAAAAGARNVSVTTGAEVVTLTNGFTVTNGTAVLTTVNPNTGQQGQTNESVNLTGQFTHWVQGTSTASFGAGITVASLTVNTATTATAVVNIDAAAAAGARNVSVTTGAETVSLANAFTVTQPVGGPAILSLTPNSALPGQAIQVLITAQNTHFVQGITQFNFGPQISVGGGPASGYGPVQVTSATTATAQVSVPNNAVVGSRTVVVQTGSEQANLVSGFVVHGTPVLSSLTPSSGQKGQTLVVTIHGTATNFQQGVSQANFGAGISVGGALAGGFGPISVTGPTTATAQIAIDAAAAVGLRTPVTVQTGVEQASLSNSGFLVLGPVIGSAPVVTITSPTEGAEVTAPTTVPGTVTSPNLSNWILEYQASASTIFTQFAAGTSATVSGTLDPSLLLNRIAQIRLTGVDQSGQTATIIVNVVVTRNVKVGNFTLSFNDLTVPVAGIPIQVIRTYDSRVKSSGDFGFGWSLSIKTTKVDVNGVLGQNWTGTKSSGFLPTYCIVPAQNYVVSIRLQGGTIYQFQPTLTSATQCSLLTPPTFVDMAFTPIGATPANATLTAPIATGLFVLGSFPGPVQLLDFDTVMPVDPDQFILTLPTGQQLTVSRTFGIQSIKDTNANTLTFSSTGITSSTGKGVIFARDAQNRITTITDPMAHVLTYNYNASGDLTTFTDQISNVSTFTYDGNHNLLSFKDPSGNQPVRSVYDDSGRLIQEIDAFGHVINLTNTPGSSSETVTDALGNPTTFVYDAHGNVLSKTDALGNLTTFTYNANDHLTSRTNALGKTYNYTYDANGNRLTEADPLGNISTYTYNSLSQIATFKDANGNFATSNTFDASGNQLTATDPLGHTKTIAYGANSGINSSVDLNGKTVSFTYDAGGNLASQTDTAGTVTNYTVDANGNRLSQTITRTTPSGPQVLTTQYQYDSMNRGVKIK